MNEFDFCGEMDVFQNQLTEAGISKEELDMDMFVGLTATELQSIVNVFINKKRKENENGKKDTLEEAKQS